MMTRSDELRAALERSEVRLQYAQRELERFVAGKPDLNSTEDARTQRKLKADLTRGENDVGVLRNMLALNEAKALA